MNTLFLLMAQYNGLAVIPLDRVCEDYFRHLTVDQFQRKANAGTIQIPITRMEAGTQKSAKGIFLTDLAKYIDERHAAAVKEEAQLNGRRLR
ncbi:pyocin activator PrtN family protein [Stutzerimonas nitrititolerans]|uniref:pyocin activator PrtN family protein n=1 Tax=Stutzerimonas nitrititolerans TaxID=2482751 RepID=UPI00289ADE52|nr:pyocin activator PrtN family protein [Stutzerimonas nitrititolerans]